MIVLEMKAVVKPSQCSAIDEAIYRWCLFGGRDGTQAVGECEGCEEKVGGVMFPMKKILGSVFNIKVKTKVKTFFGILERLGIIAAIILFVWEAERRYENTVFQAWTVVNDAKKERSGAVKIAIERLYKEGFNLKGIQVPETNLESINLAYKFRLGPINVEKEADLSYTNLSKANLSYADLSKANLSYADLSEANLSEANLNGANLSEANLIGANLTGANLIRANLSGVNLSGADLSRAYLTEADLISQANLNGADLSEAYLNEAYLTEADLSEAKLSQAKLRQANLGEANLSGADLSEADLSGAYLSGADFSKAILSGANLKNADFTRGVHTGKVKNLRPEQVKEAKNWQNARYDEDFLRLLGL